MNTYLIKKQEHNSFGFADDTCSKAKGKPTLVALKLWVLLTTPGGGTPSDRQVHSEDEEKSGDPGHSKQVLGREGSWRGQSVGNREVHVPNEKQEVKRRHFSRTQRDV